jgi:glycosyltransferase involved in cell wall biosynthesis
MEKKIIYLVSIRGASSAKPGRKISELIKLFSKKYNLIPLFGGDLPLGIGINNKKIEYGNANIHKDKYRNSIVWISLSELKDLVHNFITLFHLFKLKKNKIGLIWERSSRLHWAGLIMSRFISVPYVLEWKDNLITYNKSLFKKFAIHIEKIKILKSNYIVVESYVLKEYLVKKYNILSDKVLVAHNGVNYDEFNKKTNGANRKTKIIFNENKISVAYLGSFAFYHDSERLVRAAKILLERNSLIEIVMIGNGKDKNKCIKLAKELGVYNNNLFFKDAVSKEKVPEILNNTQIAVLPGSTDIICPIKIMEYMASGCVTLAPNYLCNKEIISHYKNGVLFEAFNEGSLANEILKLSSDGGLINKISKNARSFSRDKLSWNDTWGNVLDTIVEFESIKN